MLFQAEAITIKAEDLAVIAATLANMGVCPLTQERCLSPEIMKSVLSLMYNSGLCNYTGDWMFRVGIPSAAGVSGAHLIVIPGVAGIVIFSPRLNEFDIPVRSIKFCEMLTQRYRLNVFDQLVS
jgi:glutaminase